MHADGGQLLFAHPHAGVELPLLPRGGFAPGLDAELARGADQNFLQRAHVGDHVFAPAGKINDGIAHQLSGAVEGDVATAIAGVHFHAPPRQFFLRQQQVFPAGVPPQRNHRRVLAEDQ